jgi:hypothetical protein
MRSPARAVPGARVVVAILVSIAIAVALGLWISSLPPTDRPLATSIETPSPSSPSPTPARTTPAPSKLPSKAGLPDPVLTPGVASADVVPSNVNRTICVSGYTSGHRLDDGRTVRPPSSYTTALKREQISQYRYADTRLADYEEDHLIPLELGGDGYAPGNLWPEPYAGSTGARIKDKVENALHRLVCSGLIGLRTAQHAIATDWYAAYLQYG